MKRSRAKKILLYFSTSIILLVVVLAAHIYWAYRPKAPDANTRVLARIDIHQPLSNTDSTLITTWLYQQRGVDHVLVNPHSDIVIFTFFPLKSSANQIIGDFKKAFPFKAERFMPTAENLKHSCPVAASSFTYKVYKFITQII